jgi:hypothetical protein
MRQYLTPQKIKRHSTFGLAWKELVGRANKRWCTNSIRISHSVKESMLRKVLKGTVRFVFDSTVCFVFDSTFCFRQC